MNSLRNDFSSWKRGLVTVLAMLVLLALAGCDLKLPTLSPPDYTVPEETPTAVAADMAVVTFYVQVPPNTPPDEPVLLSILDEVTGLALNAERLTMDVVDEGNYVLGIPLQVGSVVKYRYSRRGDVLAEEHVSDGRSVRYRLYHVSAPGQVHDVVTRWNDTPFEGTAGRISGRVSDAQSGAPLAGILVASGGAQTLTTSDGHFLIEGLPPGTHNLVAYAMDGSYRTFQQGAVVAAESNTPTTVQLSRAEYVDITFLIQVPDDTLPSVPLRLAGNLLQLGNTFADLSGGINTLGARMPRLSPLPDGSYGVILSLPVGADIDYKYTLGDGFWNSERANDGSFQVRHFIVPETPTLIEERVDTWHANGTTSITFDINVPENTPPDEGVSIQFHPYGWTEPLQMWHLDGQRWAYILYSPLDLIDELGYRYCRAGQCGHADDARTPGVFSSGKVIKTSPDPMGLPDTIEAWAWLENELPSVDVTEADVQPRGSDFVAGFEIQPRYHPSWIPRFPDAFADISSKGANWVILTPSWTFTRMDPPVLELVSGQDALWPEMINMVRQAKSEDLHVALRPVPRFPTAVDAWWNAARLDFSFWISWFDQYRAFALHHADLAARSDAQTLILGGSWMAPALPGGILADGSLTNVPQDADQRYQQIIAAVREHFDGTVAWAWPYSGSMTNRPAFLNQVDQIYVLWSAPLSDDPNASSEVLQAEAERIITDEISALRTENNEIIISLAYPSVGGAFTSCLPDPIVDCQSPEALNYPAPDLPLLELNFVEQARAYDAILAALNKFDWVKGAVSRGYYPAAILHDKSISVHGKPAAEVLGIWFGRFLGRE
ncbi:MAG: carboxypeptidase regulatory-like domain-containing protein [Chloroflexota bacterium]|nr:carboxypeptidase regulatory-like domain-containing protein [Chloroflexota bacterium]